MNKYEKAFEDICNKVCATPGREQETRDNIAIIDELIARTKIYEYAKAKTREKTQCLKCPYWRETCFTNKDMSCKYQTFCDVYEDVAVALDETTYEIPGANK